MATTTRTRNHQKLQQKVWDRAYNSTNAKAWAETEAQSSENPDERLSDSSSTGCGVLPLPKRRSNATAASGTAQAVPLRERNDTKRRQTSCCANASNDVGCPRQVTGRQTANHTASGTRRQTSRSESSPPSVFWVAF